MTGPDTVTHPATALLDPAARDPAVKDHARAAAAPEPGGPPTLLVGIDGSPTARRAAAYAVALARRTGSRLVFVQVLNTATLLALAPAALPAAREAATQVAEELRAEIARRLAGSGVAWELREAAGNPYVELTAAARQEGADTIVVGASQRVGHRLLGSLSVHLVKSHEWPVIVVP